MSCTIVFKESTHAESPGSEDSSSNMDESMGLDGDADEEKGEEVKLEVSEKQVSPSAGKHNEADVDDEDGEDDDNGEEGEVEEDGNGEDAEEIEVGIRKKPKVETPKQSQLGDETIVEDEYIAMQQEGQALAVEQQKQKVFHRVNLFFSLNLSQNYDLVDIRNKLFHT